MHLLSKHSSKDYLGRALSLINLIKPYKMRLQGLGNMLPKRKGDHSFRLDMGTTQRLKSKMNLVQPSKKVPLGISCVFLDFMNQTRVGLINIIVVFKVDVF